MLSREDATEVAWDFARKVAEIDKQLLSHSAVRAVADALLAVQDETARECAEMLETQGVMLTIVPGETRHDRCVRFARAFAVKIRARFGLEGK